MTSFFWILKYFRSNFSKNDFCICKYFITEFAKNRLFDDKLTMFEIQILWYTNIVIFMFFEKSVKCSMTDIVCT